MSPAALDDPSAPRKQLSGPNRVNFQPSKLLPLSKSLRDGTEIIITPYINGYHDAPLKPIVETLCEELNGEIERGDTYPMDEIMSVDLFKGYWFGNFAAVVTVRGGPDDGTVLGSFHVKPNYPGRCSHVCNGAFLTAKAARARGVGRVMAETFLVYAPLLGYKSSIFNLVFESNVASCKLWDRLGFTRSGRVKDAGWLKVGGEEKYVDAIVFQKFFDTPKE
ncbi:hypothetical protein TWF569_002429 [Orbilia oligospora]|uniref:N-acetyltransferase domain-containing protein n=1 Tax=Orbilia oligospora TaxID=2813651 RepID=A0A7C8JMS9_ORBOL|nr:hypothetical protein TWF569_002429 [Orbilia oligospora]KAF3132251.1 hypothetical protein TWF703_007369 [Orbilia oligospora]